MTFTTSRRLLATLFASCLVFGAAAGAASAQPQNDQDGLVNVAVFDITVIGDDVVVTLNEVLSDNNVAVGLAAQIAATVCGVKVGPLAVLGQAVDRSGATSTVCTNDLGTQRVDFVQN